MTAAWILTLLLAFGIGVLTGLYLSSHSVGTAKHRQPVSPRPVLMPPTPVEDTPTKSQVDEYLSEHVDQTPWKEAVASWRETAKPIDWGLTEEEKRRPLNPKLVEAMHDPYLDQKLELDPDYLRKIREHYDIHSTAEEMENGHWEGLNGTLEANPEPKVLRPEETSSSLLGLSEGTIKPTAGLKPVFGETEHLEYDPDDYEEPLICQPCKRSLVKGETFWAVSLPEEGEGVFIPICDDCEAKSHG